MKLSLMTGRMEGTGCCWVLIGRIYLAIFTVDNLKQAERHVELPGPAGPVLTAVGRSAPSKLPQPDTGGSAGAVSEPWGAGAASTGAGFGAGKHKTAFPSGPCPPDALL